MDDPRPMGMIDRRVVNFKGGVYGIRSRLARFVAFVGSLIESGWDWPYIPGKFRDCTMVCGPADGNVLSVRGAMRFVHLPCYRSDHTPTTALYERAPYQTNGNVTYLFVGMMDDLIREGMQ